MAWSICHGMPQMPLANLKSKLFYNELVPCRVPTAQGRWVAEGADFGEDWHMVYEMAHKVTASTRLQSLQHIIIHRLVSLLKAWVTGRGPGRRGGPMGRRTLVITQGDAGRGSVALWREDLSYLFCVLRVVSHGKSVIWTLGWAV